MNNDRFNFLTDRINYKSLTDFSFIDERLYGEALFSQGEIYSNPYMDRVMADFVKFLNSTHFDKLHHDCSNTIVTQQEHKGVQGNVCFIIYTLNFKNDFLKTLQKGIDRKFLK